MILLKVFAIDGTDMGNASWPMRRRGLIKPFEIFCKSILKVYCPLTVRGANNLPNPPFLICSNHTSHVDSAMLMTASGLPFKRIGLIAAKDYFFEQGHRQFLHYLMNLIPLARGSGTRAIQDSLNVCRSFLSHGGLALIIFPEGTRSVSGEMRRFKEGAAILAHALDLPMVPACVAGSDLCLPKGSYFLRPKKLSVRFGKPIRVADFLAFDERHDRRATFHAFREAMIRVEDEVKRMKALKEADDD